MTLVPEKSIRNGGPAVFAATAGAGGLAGIDRLPAKSILNGGLAEFAVTDDVGWTGGIDRLPAKSIRSGAPGAALGDRCCAVASTSKTKGTAARNTVAASRRNPIPKAFPSMAISKSLLWTLNP